MLNSTFWKRRGHGGVGVDAPFRMAPVVPFVQNRLGISTWEGVRTIVDKLSCITAFGRSVINHSKSLKYEPELYIASAVGVPPHTPLREFKTHTPNPLFQLNEMCVSASVAPLFLGVYVDRCSFILKLPFIIRVSSDDVTVLCFT